MKIMKTILLIAGIPGAGIRVIAAAFTVGSPWGN